MKKRFAFWLWRLLAGGSMPFYSNPALEKFQTYAPPDSSAWMGYKLELWNWAVEYLVSIGELTYTPTLSGKF